MAVFKKPDKPGGRASDDSRTRLVTRPGAAGADSPAHAATPPRLGAGADGATRLVGPDRVPEAPPSEQGAGQMDDPVVGWLVVIDGPGRGASLSLGYGNNQVGRSEECRVVVNFGDDQISRTTHCVVTYDPRSRRFFVLQGEGSNLTYLGDDVVLTPTEIHLGSRISIGQTTMAFVPFCGPDFDWQS